jgi:hypothetical protein
LLHRDFQCHFNGRRSVVGEKQMRQFRRDPLPQPRCQFFRSIVSEARKDDVFKFFRLAGNRRGNSRMRVPVKIHPPRGDGIQYFSPIFGVEIDTLCFLHLQRSRIKP